MDSIHTALTDKVEQKKAAIEQNQKDVELAYKKLEEIGYVNKEISILTGLKVGTLSSKAREALQERYFELQDAAQQLQDEITKKNVDHQYKLEELNVANKQKQVEAKQKAAAGEILAKLSGMSGVDALKEVQNNIGMLSDVLGDQLMDVVTNIRTQIDKDQSEALQNKRLSLSIAAQDRATAASDRAAAAAERAAEASENKKVKEEVDTYNDIIKRDIAFGYIMTNDPETGKPTARLDSNGNPIKSNEVNKTKVVKFIDKLISEDVDSRITDELYKRWIS